MKICLLFTFIVLVFPKQLEASPVISVNQVGYDVGTSKQAILTSGLSDGGIKEFYIISVSTGKTVFTGIVLPVNGFDNWGKKRYYKMDFSSFNKTGRYYLATKGHWIAKSPVFEIDNNLLARKTLPALAHYFRNQRANTLIETENDKNIPLFGSEKTVDLAGGWCDASGDVSKYFSHLAYSNFFSPQQIPLVTWALADAAEKMPTLLKQLNLTDSIQDEARYGADYLLKSLSEDGYFYMIVFSYFNKDPKARRVVGLLANSVTTDEYQCAFREGAGMAIATLAKMSRWNSIDGYRRRQYLRGAERAFSYLLVNNRKFCDDGKENIIDDYCLLMAACELFEATGNRSYLEQARLSATNLENRLTSRGYFISDDKDRPYYHASDAGMPLTALKRYIEIERDKKRLLVARAAIERNLRYQFKITREVSNPFGYARQTFKFQEKIIDSFFIPHQNETGWWWQGENARLASLASAAIASGMGKESQRYGMDQINWILGLNPYQVCFMYGLGTNNVPYMASNYGHGSRRGGISNGITGLESDQAGFGIDFKEKADGNEWRWTEQWLPHAAWFLQAITTMKSEK